MALFVIHTEHLSLNSSYDRATTILSLSAKKQRKLRLATILGFIGMLRPHIFQQIGVKSLIIVRKDESCSSLTPFNSGTAHWRRNNTGKQAVLGFYITFTSKTQRHAKAYFPNISELKGNLAKICPIAALFDLHASRLIRDGFLSNLGRGSPLCNYLQEITGNTSSISPYSLRIRGRTWYITMGLDRQFVDYLGTWASPESSARYYRARPAAALVKSRQLYVILAGS